MLKALVNLSIFFGGFARAFSLPFRSSIERRRVLGKSSNG